jgi:hypothetical protein
MFGWFSEASNCASRLKRARRSGSAANSSGRKDLQRDIAIEPRIARAILAHPARADEGDDLVGAESSPRGKRHGLLSERARIIGRLQVRRNCRRAAWLARQELPTSNRGSSISA